MNKLADKKSFMFLLIFMCAFCWGASFIFMNQLLEKLFVFQILAVRWTVAVVFFVIMAALKVVKLDYKGKPLKPLILTGLMQPVIYAVAEIYGLKYTNASEASIVIATIPLMALILGMTFFHNKVQSKAIVAILLAFGGIVISILFSPRFSLGGSNMQGYLYLVIAVVAAGFYSYASSKASEFYSPIEITFAMTFMAMVAFNIINFAFGYGISGYVTCFTDIKLGTFILFLGILCSCFCYIVFNLCIKKIKPIVATNVIANSTTAIGVILGCLIDHDPFGWFTVVGVIMTIAGVILASTVDTSK